MYSSLLDIYAVTKLNDIHNKIELREKNDHIKKNNNNNNNNSKNCSI
jgi:hypothetical protein